MPNPFNRADLTEGENTAITVGTAALIGLIVGILGTVIGAPFWLILPIWAGISAYRTVRQRQVLTAGTDEPYGPGWGGNGPIQP